MGLNGIDGSRIPSTWVGTSKYKMFTQVIAWWMHKFVSCSCNIVLVVRLRIGYICSYGLPFYFLGERLSRPLPDGLPVVLGKFLPSLLRLSASPWAVFSSGLGGMVRYFNFPVYLKSKEASWFMLMREISSNNCWSN